MSSDELRYHVFEDYNIAFDEKGATCGSVRKVQWLKGDKEPDINKAKVEIRKLYVNGEEEKTGKGYAFSTPEGPGELAVGLIEAGFGETKKILRAVSKREDFVESVNTINEDTDDDKDGELFDMRNLLMSIEETMEAENE